MPYKTPTLKENYEQFKTNLVNRLKGINPALRRSVVVVISRTWAGSMNGLYGFAYWCMRQRFVDTAEIEALELMANPYGIFSGKEKAATGSVSFVGTLDTTIPVGTELQNANGGGYVTDSEVTLNNGAASVSVTALAAGSDGNMNATASLELIQPLGGVSSTVLVAEGGLALGTDAEAIASFRSRFKDRLQQPPHGGSLQDYYVWARDQSAHDVAVTRAWPSPQEMGAGTVTVRFMMDDSYGDGIPLAADVAAVQAYVNSVRPVTATVYVVAPLAAPLSFAIDGLNPVSATVKAAVEAELKDLIRREAEPSGALLVSHIREAISIAAGEYDHELVSPVANVTTSTGEIITFGGITWT